MTRHARIRIRDVADAAGVSTATVSYVLNETPGQTITDATRDRVRQAALRLGYTPHGVARTLREGRSRIVLLEVGSLTAGTSLDDFVSGMADELRRHDHVLLVTPGGADASVLAAVSPRAVVDLTTVATGSEHDDPISGRTQGSHVGLAFHAVTQLRHLAERGHRRIAFALPSYDGGALANTRLAHARRAAAELGLPPLEVLHAADSVRRLIEDTDVTAVAAFDDDTALAVLAAMRADGYHAPDDLAVLGFDETRHAALCEPRLSTVRIDASAYGKRAARISLDLDPGTWEQPPSEVVVGATT
ncbi:LacI family DNA-binding transcriptional regulator [Rhodococcus sp. HNM0569]|uniref:LacI family DNA-binding transcriptional regulator n=1 Tax=Rhodococcus sp. HNM0569 TaxID=2716340 RepID=UPI00146CA1DF|nr:LacI family DNA-binding transcriptional regulator [Rhodococcus sp. HNM0569]NLU84836.1 LacI family transcriptional regulator [Rhodococcus sp. HNM0569]